MLTRMSCTETIDRIERFKRLADEVPSCHKRSAIAITLCWAITINVICRFRFLSFECLKEDATTMLEVVKHCSLLKWIYPWPSFPGRGLVFYFVRHHASSVSSANFNVPSLKKSLDRCRQRCEDRLRLKWAQFIVFFCRRRSGSRCVWFLSYASNLY